MVQLLMFFKNLISGSDASNPNDERPELATRVFLKLLIVGAEKRCELSLISHG